jgi:tetratricopeptide (TPR) repeat protein
VIFVGTSNAWAQVSDSQGNSAVAVADQRPAESVVPEASSVAAADEAEAAFRNGARAFERGDIRQALKQMRTAFRLRPDYRTAAGLGQVELHLQRHRDAAEHLEFALRHYPNAADPEGRGRLIDGFKAARTHVGSLSLEGQIPGTELFIDGRKVATLPVVYDLFVEPGEHRFTFQKPGFDAYEQSQLIGEGGLHSLEVKLGAEHVQAAARPPRQHSVATPTPLADWLLLSGGVLAVGALGAGVAFEWDADRAQAEADRLQSELNAPCGPEASSSTCVRARSLWDDVRARRDIASASFIGAAAVAVVSVGIYSWLGYAPRADRGQPGVSWNAGVAPGQANVVLWGVFE